MKEKKLNYVHENVAYYSLTKEFQQNSYLKIWTNYGWKFSGRFLVSINIYDNCMLKKKCT